MKKFLFLALIIVMGVVCQTAFADDPTDAEVDEIQLRDPLQLERAAMEYMLAFEAYTAARKSKDPKIRNGLVKLMREYRNSYARFLEMLREDKLYKPNRPKDPAGWYDKKHKKTKGYKRDWKKTDAKEIRKEVKEMVKNGASPEQVNSFIKGKLPSAPLSIALPVSTSLSTSSAAQANTPTLGSSNSQTTTPTLGRSTPQTTNPNLRGPGTVSPPTDDTARSDDDD